MGRGSRRSGCLISCSHGSRGQSFQGEVKSSWIGHCSPRSDGGVALYVIARTGQLITFAQGSVITRVISGEANAFGAAATAKAMPNNTARTVCLIFMTVLHESSPASDAEVCEEDRLGYRIMPGLNFM